MLPPFRGAVKVLILACGGAFLLQILLQLSGLGGQFLQIFGLIPSEVLAGRVWQLVTYLFFHGGISHLIFNMLGLWFFGSTLETEWGTRRFLYYYFLTGIGAGITTVVFGPHSQIPTIGASGAILGVLLAFGVLHPNAPV